jgi:meiotically up-regulated gene 157 (Mug157) protein
MFSAFFSSIGSPSACINLTRLLQALGQDLEDPALLASRASQLAAQIDAGIHRYGVFQNATLGPMSDSLSFSESHSSSLSPLFSYAFESDGRLGQLLIDDANVPSLLSLPYLGYVSKRDPGGRIAANTRRFVLSAANPFYYTSEWASGIGACERVAASATHPTQDPTTRRANSGR